MGRPGEVKKFREWTSSSAAYGAAAGASLAARSLAAVAAFLPAAVNPMTKSAKCVELGKYFQALLQNLLTIATSAPLQTQIY